MDLNISVCVPTVGLMRSQFVNSLLALYVKQEIPPKYEYIQLNCFIREGANLQDNREKLVVDSLNCKSTHILFIDDDMEFNTDVLNIMLSREAPVVLANYVTRRPPHRFTASVPTTPMSPETEETDYGGLGLALIEASVFHKVPQPWFAQEFNPETGSHVSEDICFFRKVKKEGIPILVDHTVSKMIKHIGTQAYAWNDFV